MSGKEYRIPIMANEASQREVVLSQMNTNTNTNAPIASCEEESVFGHVSDVVAGWVGLDGVEHVSDVVAGSL